MSSSSVANPTSKRSSDPSAGAYPSESRHKLELVSRRVLIVLLYLVALIVCLLLAVVYFLFIWPAKRVRKSFSKDDEPLTNDWWGLHAGDDANARDARKPKDLDMRKGVELTSCYITTRDGVKLATDVWIPKKALESKGKLPVIFHQARYYRSAILRWPFNLIVNGGKPISFINDPFFKSFLSHDMILVSVDVRGTGASFGKHPGPWSPEEQEDSMEVLDWIERQPWSNGKVGLWGVSYEATSAFFTSLQRHPTVVCCCPMFFFWEVYDDISHPGGVPMRHFSVSWQGFNDSLDSGWVQSTGWMARIFLEGVTPVGTEDPWGYQAKRALVDHKDNWSLLEDDHIRYMDDTSKRSGRAVKSACASEALQRLLAKHGATSELPISGEHVSIDERITVEGVLSDDTKAGTGAEELERTLPYYLHVSGWLDASANAAIMAFMSLPCRGSELLVGPWNHGGHQHVRPHHITSRSRFDFQTEVSGFLVGRLSALNDDPASKDGPGSGTAAQAEEEQDTSRPADSGTEPTAGAQESVAADAESAKDAATRDNEIKDAGEVDDSGDCVEGGLVQGQEVGAGGAEREEGSTQGLAWRRARPRVRFYTHQEERWHEADTFPSAPTHKTDVVLSLGKRRPPIPPATTPSGVGLVSRLGNKLNNTRHSSMAFFRSRSFAGGARSGGWIDSDGGGDQRSGSGAFFRELRDGVAGLGALDPSESKIDDDAADDDGGDATRVIGDGDDINLSPPGDNAKTSPPSGGDVAVTGMRLGGDNPGDAKAAGVTTRADEAKKDAKEDVWDAMNEPVPEPFVMPLDGNPKPRAEIKDAAGNGRDGDNNNKPGAVAAAASGEHRKPKLRVDISESTGTQEIDGDTPKDDGALVSTPDASGSASGGKGETVTPRDASGGVRERMSLRRWRHFRKPKLTLSQDAFEDEETHELEVDVENDRDGEGVSRWAAMTEFLSLISYQMDGLRSNHMRFTSPPLKQDMEVTGFPVVTLWVSAADDLPNLDVFAYLQAVRPRTGLSIYVTEGCFRAEHRKKSGRRLPVEVRALPGVPVHSYLRKDAQPLEKGRPVELKFKLMPTSFKFLKGQRVRLSIGGADARHFHPITKAPPAAAPLVPGATDTINQGEGPDPIVPTDGVPMGVPVGTTIPDGVPVVDADGVEDELNASVPKRVLRVHTGGGYTSNVSLPVPRSDGVSVGGSAGRGLRRKARGESKTGVKDGSGSDGEYGVLGQDRAGARENVATPRNGSFARDLWSRRTRSLSSPDISIATPFGPLRGGRWAAESGATSVTRGRGELPSLGVGTRRDAILACWEEENSNIFEDY